MKGETAVREKDRISMLRLLAVMLLGLVAFAAPMWLTLQEEPAAVMAAGMNQSSLPRIALSDVDNRRGYELTVTGTGFTGGTAAAFYVLHDPAVTSSALDDGASEAALCRRIIDQGALVVSSVVGSDGWVSGTFEVTVPTFGPGNSNYICVVDGAGRMPQADVERFHLEHSLRLSSTTARAGDSITIIAQDFPTAGTALTELKVGGRPVVANNAGVIGTDGAAAVTFTVPSGLIGIVLVEARWGNVSGTTRLWVLGTQTPPLTRPFNVQAVSNASGELTLTWLGGANADSYVLIAVHMGTFDYETATVSGGAARTGTVTGLIGGENYLGIVVALQATAAGLETLYGSAAPVPVQSGGPESATDRAVLVALYNATGGANWTDNTNWLSTVPISEWYGVVTDDGGRVTELHLAENRLAGGVPLALGNLSSLTYLGLHRNQLTGSITGMVGNLANLEVLSLGGNQFTGTIPVSLGNLTNLTEMYLWGSELTGPVPAWLGNLSNLEVLNLGDNQLTGAIPTQLGNLSKLTALRLYSNQLTGTIPAQLGNLPNLTELHLYENQLTGTVPSQLGNVTNLTQLELSRNQLMGPIPMSLGNLSSLRELHLHRNQLTGSVPSQLGNLTNLEVLSLGGNQFTGTIPTSLGNLTNLTEMYLWGSELTGPVPAWLGNLTNLTQLELSDNQLTGAIPDTLGNLSNRRRPAPTPPARGVALGGQRTDRSRSWHVGQSLETHVFRSA